MLCLRHFCTALLPAVLCLAANHAAADEFERPPIEYSQTAPDNRVSRLQAQLERDEAKLEFAERTGYLPALLAALDVPVDSQTLVFSKTSLQRDRISPRTPRALYFNDDVYVGYCHSGDVLEISAADSEVGTAFYTLDQRAVEKPRFTRQTDSCLICHSSSRTEGIPGHVVRSLFTSSSGEPIYSGGSRTVDHTTPLADRWGGWYVSGTHGEQTHQGNLLIRGKEVPTPLDNSQGHNVTDLSERFHVDGYLAPHSDLIALMVLEHQTLVHNRLTKANFTTRQALHYQESMNRALGEAEDHQFESTLRRISSAGDRLVEAMLFVDEAELTAPLEGTSQFAKTFPSRGPRDSQGRSLRDFDLRKRIFAYPCSYLIYSEAFDDLPEEVAEYVWHRLWNVLTQEADAEKFAHLSAADKRAIVEIIRETKPQAPEYWRAGDAAP